MRVQNGLDRFNLALLAMSHLPNTFDKTKCTKYCYECLKKHEWYIREYGKDIPEVTEWKWKNVNE